MNSIVHVAVAVIRDNDGRVFVAQRPDHVHQGGLWEFPGGKVEPGESVLNALHREIKEEIGVVIQKARPLIKIPYRYPDKHVLLDVWEVLQSNGEPRGKEGQPCQWIGSNDLGNWPFPAANRAIISAVKLPSTFLVTPEPCADEKLFLENLERCITSGIRWLAFRAKTLSESDYKRLARKVCEIGLAHNATVMLSTDLETIDSLAAAGLHVTASQLMDLEHRPLSVDKWFSASCHSREEIEHASSIGVDFIFVGSVMQTASHKDIKPMGWDAFLRLTEFANMPVYAIGGMTLEDQEKSHEMGGQGIAAIRALWT